MPRSRRSHPGHIERRGCSHRVTIEIDGERHRFSVKGVSDAEAEAFARRKHEELEAAAKRKRLGLPGATPVGRLFDRYGDEALPLLASSTQASYRATLRLFDAFLEKRGLTLDASEVRSGHVQEFLSYARVNPVRSSRTVVSNRTLERHRAVLSAVFSFAEKLELVEFNPVRKITPPKVDARDPVILSDEQFEALVAETAERPMLRLYVLVLAETGVRAYSECLWLRWEDVDLEDGFVRIVSGRHDHRTKSGEGRWVPMTPRLRTAMREHFARYRFAHYRSPWVFHHELRKRHAEAGDRLKSLHRAFNSAAERAGLPPELRQHDLRHRRVTTWLAEGKPIRLVQEAMGHSTVRVTEGYSHLAREHLRALVADDVEPLGEAHERGA